jgi:cyanophycinase
MSAPVFLHGGGSDPIADAACFGPFIEAVRRFAGVPRVALVLHQQHADDLEAYRAMLARGGLSAEWVTPVLVSGERQLSPADLQGMGGVFVAGGITPDVHYALCQDITWLRTVQRGNLPYCGTSAGAAIACRHAIVGGWRTEHRGRTMQVMHPAGSEGLDLLDVRAGLGLVPPVFQAIDVHASQMGTVLRALHLVLGGEYHTVGAIDENTMVEFDAGNVVVHGAGHFYEVRRVEHDVIVNLFRA